MVVVMGNNPVNGLLDIYDHNLSMLVISLELLLLSVGVLLVNITSNLDDLVGANLTLLILPLAGAESAVALALLVAFYPLRGYLNCCSWCSSMISAGLFILPPRA